MTSKTLWTWVFFTTMSAMLLFPALMPQIVNTPSPSMTPAPASYTLPFTPIVNNAENPVGNITITKISLAVGFNLTFGNITTKWLNGTLNQTYSFARMDTSTSSGGFRSSNIYFSWYEYVEFNKSQQNSDLWLNYSSKVPEPQLESVEYNTTTGWGNLAIAPANYYIFLPDPNLSNRYVLNLSLASMNTQWSTTNYAKVLVRIKYSYEIPITQWQVVDNATAPILLPNMTNTLNQTYRETFRIDAPELTSGTEPYINLTVTYVPFYREGVAFISLWNKSSTDAGATYHQVLEGKYIISKPANNMTFVTNTSADYQVYFGANFTIQFDQAVNPPDIYAVDRLASEDFVREHWYYVKVTGGPNLLRIANVVFNDTNVGYADTIGTSTYFGRSLSKNWNNYTAIISGNSTIKNNGTTLTSGPNGYFVSGETDVLILSYKATKNLTILIADQIVTPVPGASVTLLRDGIRYGSYISRDESFNQPPKLADERGIVVFTDLPSFGNYSISLDFAGTNYGIYYVSLTKTPNILTTTIPHFPTWVIIWASFCALITVIGFSKYKQNKNVPETETR